MQRQHRQRQNVYIFQNNTYHYFRQVIPADLRPKIAKTEFRFSLRTPDRATARRKAACLSARIWDIFTALRKGEKYMTALTAEEIQGLVKKWVEYELAEDEANRILNAQTTQRKAANDEDEFDNVIDSYDYGAADAREALALGNYAKVKDFADDILQDNGLEASPTSLEYKQLCHEILKGQIELCQILKARSLGVYPTTYTAQAIEGRADKPQEHTGTKASKTTLSAAVKAYIEDKKLHGNWRPRTEMEIKDKLGTLIELMGDIPLHEITQSKLKVLERQFLIYPKNRSKKPKYRDRSIKDIFREGVPEEDRISPRTVANYFIQLNTFFRWCKTMYELPNWLSEILIAPKQAKKQDTRESKAPFTDEDLRKIFGCYWYSETPNAALKARDARIDPPRFWLPLMALYSGARPEELSQLYLSDFKIIDGVKCMHITDTLDDEDDETVNFKKTKNQKSNRVVPLHGALLKLGLWEYVQELKKQGKTRLFEELKVSGVDQRIATAYSKWFNRHLTRDTGIPKETPEGKKCFYSFRHTFINYCVQHGLEDSYFEPLVGHATDGNDVTYAYYAKALNPKTLKREVLDKISFDVDLSHLLKSPFVREAKGKSES